MTPFRSPIFVPGNRRNMLEKAQGFNADFLVPDLEDSVPLAEKEDARSTVREMLPTLADSGRRLIVRINSLDTGLTEQDLEAVFSGKLFGITVGKLEMEKEIKEYDRLLSRAEAREGVAEGTARLVPWLENASAVRRAYDIATASPRIVAVTFGAEDYTQSMGIQRTETSEELYFPRASIALAAAAAGVVALDTPFVRFRDPEGLEQDIQHALKLGYKGKFAIHPAQLETINRMFSPNPEDVEYARRVVEAWERAEAEGRGSVDLDGHVIDVPVVKRARDLLALEESIKRT